MMDSIPRTSHNNSWTQTMGLLFVLIIVRTFASSDPSAFRLTVVLNERIKRDVEHTVYVSWSLHVRSRQRAVFNQNVSCITELGIKFPPLLLLLLD